MPIGFMNRPERMKEQQERRVEDYRARFIVEPTPKNFFFVWWIVFLVLIGLGLAFLVYDGVGYKKNSKGAPYHGHRSAGQSK